MWIRICGRRRVSFLLKWRPFSHQPTEPNNAVPDNQHPNSVMRLRAEILSRSTREFRARGSRVVRCEHCLLARDHCICMARPTVESHSAFCFVMYHGESLKPSNTGRLIADVVPDNHAFLWQRTQADPALLALLGNPRYAPIVVFPHEYAEPERCIHQPADLPAVASGKIPLFVMLDGTWREAKKMFRSSPYLAGLPVLGVQPSQASAYLMRDAAHAHQLSTVEVGIELLRLARDNAAAEALATYFDIFCRHYLAIRPHLHEKRREFASPVVASL